MSSFIVRRGLDVVMVTSDDIYHNVMYLDRDADPVLVQNSDDHYAVWKGHWHIGDVYFVTESTKWGWRFSSRCSQFRASRKLHPYPEATLRGKVIIKQVYGRGNSIYR